MRVFGIIGYPLSHSFSQKYFTEKFEQLSIHDAQYNVYPLKNIDDFKELIKTETSLKGLNVTIPYKRAVIKYIDQLDPVAKEIGAINVIKFTPDGMIGFNSDYYGFLNSLKKWIGDAKPKALVLGTGGASAAVAAALKTLNIPFHFVSRDAKPNAFTYSQLQQNPDLVVEHQLIINTSPVGMHPTVAEAPQISYDVLTTDHFLYDLVYNPEETLFMKKGAKHGAKVKNGLEMLHLQAEKAWEIWNA